MLMLPLFLPLPPIIIISPVCRLSPINDYIVMNGMLFIIYSIILILSRMIKTEIGRNVNLDHTNLSFRDGSYEDTAFNTMKRLRTNNHKKITMGHLNINSIPVLFLKGFQCPTGKIGSLVEGVSS